MADIELNELKREREDADHICC